MGTIVTGTGFHDTDTQTQETPEFYRNSDGQDKQDCESNAAKRFVRRLHQAHPRQTFLVVGDGLMSHQPLIETTLNEGMHYLFALKPGDHAYLMDWLAAYTDWPSHTWQDDKGRTHHYRLGKSCWICFCFRTTTAWYPKKANTAHPREDALDGVARLLPAR